MSHASDFSTSEADSYPTSKTNRIAFLFCPRAPEALLASGQAQLEVLGDSHLVAATNKWRASGWMLQPLPFFSSFRETTRRIILCGCSESPRWAWVQVTYGGNKLIPEVFNYVFLLPCLLLLALSPLLSGTTFPGNHLLSSSCLGLCFRGNTN